jgi:hypothetical protein
MDEALILLFEIGRFLQAEPKQYEMRRQLSSKPKTFAHQSIKFILYSTSVNEGIAPTFLTTRVGIGLSAGVK